MSCARLSSLAVFKIIARDHGHYKGPSGAFVTYCNISFFFFLKKCKKLLTFFSTKEFSVFGYKVVKHLTS